MSTAAAKAIDKLPGGLWLAAGAAVGVLMLANYARRNIDKVNPASPDNIVYTGVNNIGDQLDDGEDNNSFSLGSWIYDLFHPYDGFELTEQAQIYNNPGAGYAISGDQLINKRPGIAE